MGGRIVLASASPRRSALLAAAGLAFEAQPTDVPEALEGFDDPAAACRELAARKARARAETIRGAALVIGADTVVAVPRGASPAAGWELLGKPADAAEARAMLASLAATRHLVATGVCVVRTPDGASWDDLERTWVSMRAISPAELEAYAASGEWRGKAGGYAIQETADRFVERLEEGGFDNVVGLPVARTLRLLRAAGWSGAAGLEAPRERG